MLTYVNPSRKAFELDRKAVADCFRPLSPTMHSNDGGFDTDLIGLNHTDSDKLFSFPFPETTTYASSYDASVESECPQPPLRKDISSPSPQNKLALITDYVELPFYAAADVVLSAMMSGKEPTSQLEKMLIVYYKAACLHTWGYPKQGSNAPTLIQPSRRAEMMLMRLEGEIMAAMENEVELTTPVRHASHRSKPRSPTGHPNGQNDIVPTHHRRR